MNWDDSYTVSRSIVLQIGDGGELLAGNSVSRMPQALSQDGLPVLLAFAGGRTPAEALGQLRNDWEIDDAGFTGSSTRSWRRISHPGGQRRRRARDRRLCLAGRALRHGPRHLRVSAYRRAISHCKDKTVVDRLRLGHPLDLRRQGRSAPRDRIEESRIADLAAAMFEANGVADRIELRRANSRDVSLDERADVIIHEVLASTRSPRTSFPSSKTPGACSRRAAS